MSTHVTINENLKNEKSNEKFRCLYEKEGTLKISYIHYC